jgi:glucose/arabinose dehydrogenase
MIFKQISSFLKTFLNSRDFRRMKKRIMFMLTLLFFPAIASCEQIVGIATQQGEELILPEGDMVRVDVWIKNLDIPWSLIFLPDGRALVSERPGSIRLRRAHGPCSSSGLSEKTVRLRDAHVQKQYWSV